MQNDEDHSHYEGALLEEIRDQNKVILEGLGDLKGLPAKVDKLADDMTDVKADLKVIRAVMKDHSGQLDNHETRITQLESA